MYELKNDETTEKKERRVPPALAAAMSSREREEQPSGEKRIDRAADFREKMARATKRRRRNRILDILLVVFLLTFLVSGFFLVRYFIQSKQNKELLGNLKEMIDTRPSTDSGSTEQGQMDKNDPGYQTSDAEVPEYVTENGQQILRMYRALYQKNNDFMGWLSIEGTNVDLPVMYAPNYEQKYLRKNFEGEYALAGTPFISEECDPKKPSANLIIYGHNMKDGSMFSDILNYKDEDFYRQHKYIQFDTIYRKGTYEVIAAFPGQVLERGEEGFRYYYFFDAEDAEAFDTYIREVKARCTYSIPETAVFGDELITLSTCEDSGASEGKRYVLVAKRVKTE